MVNEGVMILCNKPNNIPQAYLSMPRTCINFVKFYGEDIIY